MTNNYLKLMKGPKLLGEIVFFDDRDPAGSEAVLRQAIADRIAFRARLSVYKIRPAAAIAPICAAHAIPEIGETLDGPDATEERRPEYSKAA